jgi:GT2 family glycosyltransferase
VLFVDCSDDGSAGFVEERFPEIRVLPFQGNLGFARGNNLLASHACGEFLLLLNPDTVPAADEITRLLEFARARPQAGAWGGRCILPSGAADHGSHQPLPSIPRLTLMAVGLGRLWNDALPLDARSPQRVPVISGAFLLVRANTWKTLGGFDDRFVLYSEEVDLCRRIKDLGFELWAEPSIVLIHDAGSGDPYSPHRRTLVLKGVSTYLRKHHGPILANLGCAILAFEELLRAACSPLIALRNPDHARNLRRRCWPQVRNWRAWWTGWKPGDTLG